MSARAGLAFACLALAACGANGPGQVGDGQFSSLYDPGLVSHAGRSGMLRVVVEGAPVAGADPATVVAAMHVPSRLTDAHLVPADAAASGEGYRLVLRFGAADQGNPCAADSGGANADSVSTHLRASFCLGPDPLSSVSAEGPKLAGPDDPALQLFMHQVISSLLPDINPLRFRQHGSGA